MGAIAGCIGPRPRSVEMMLTAMTHRGPDERALINQDGVILGIDRLVLSDSPTGRQPLTNEDGTIWLVCNGEIFNYEQLRIQLAGAGHRFETLIDGETIVHLYEECGAGLLHELDGTFAFALLTPDGLMLARDPLGIKPLYTGRDAEGKLYFASELKALLPHVVEVAEFPPGHYWTETDGFVKYYHLPPVTEDLPDPETAVAEITGSLTAAVQSQLPAGGPAGVFLSGGLDSSLIAALAVTHSDEQPVHSFAVGLRDSDDLLQARAVAEHIGTMHHELAFDADLPIRLLPTIVTRLESYDPALVRSAIPTFIASRLAGNYVKVALSGEGADELFAGYHYLKMPTYRRDLQAELRTITLAMHNSGLQRVDRMSMANSLAVRLPFLSERLLQIAWRIPATWKLHPAGVEKWILRQAARNYLPEVIWQRAKAKFAIGTGVGPVLEEYADTVVTDSEFEAAVEQFGHLGIKNKEALLYYRLFTRAFGRRATQVAPLVGFSRSLNHDQLYEG